MVTVDNESLLYKTDISDGTKQIWGEEPPLMEVCWTHHKSLSRRHWGDVPGFRGCEVGACCCWGAGERSAGALGSQYLRRASHTLTLLSTLHQETTARVDMCKNNHFSTLVTWCQLFVPNNTIVVLKSYNYKCNPDQSNALCAIKHYVR